MATESRNCLIVAGPTASGKSALALGLARAADGIVINADSMQVYSGLSVLTARPGPADEKAAPHRLYGILDPGDSCSAARWRSMAIAEIEAAWGAGKLPILCGGTGLYLRALIQGLSPIPEIPQAVRDEARALQAEIGQEEFHRLLVRQDPVMAARLKPMDVQRCVRAFEVIKATGKSLAYWQEEKGDAFAADYAGVVLMPPRDVLYAACDGRFLAMMKAGALDEAKALLARNLDPRLPAMKALGVPELALFLAGEIGEAEAVRRAQRATRHYAKRQTTWFRHQLSDEKFPILRVFKQYSESLWDEIFPFIRRFLLTAGN